MSSPVLPMHDDAFAPDPERLLEAYAASVRIVASPQLLRRLNQSVAEERAAAQAGRVARVAARLGRGGRDARRAEDPPERRPSAGTLLRLPSLALLLLLLLSVGAAVGGAGAMISALEARQDGSKLPGQLIAPVPALPVDPTPAAQADPPAASTIGHAALLRGTLVRVTERVESSPGPVVRLSVHPQRRPAAGHHRALARWRAHVVAAREARRAGPASLRGLSGGQGRIGCHTLTADGDAEDAAGGSLVRAGALALPRSQSGVCAF